MEPAITLERIATVRDAVEAMQQEGMSCVLVVDQGRLAGIFTERDVMTKVVAQEVDVDRVQMQEVMQPAPDSLGPVHMREASYARSTFSTRHKSLHNP